LTDSIFLGQDLPDKPVNYIPNEKNAECMLFRSSVL